MINADSELLLINGLINGDAGSYRELVDCYWKSLNFLARRLLGNTHDAADCVQEAYIQVIKNIHGFERKSSLETWLRKIVVNQSLMKLRRQRGMPEESLDAIMHQFDESGHYVLDYAGQPADLERLQESSEVREIVRKKMDSLPDIYRATLILRDVEGYSTEEVARMTDTTEQNVKVRLHRARLAMRNMLEPVLRVSK
ncbi:MAG: RNA polymerase sigma factor [Gammaproteobacteria bacterium]